MSQNHHRTTPVNKFLLIAAFTFVAGLIGFTLTTIPKQNVSISLSASAVINVIYQTISLFTGGVNEDIPEILSNKDSLSPFQVAGWWVVSIARVLAPVCLTGAVVELLGALWKPRFNRYCIQRRKNHIVVYGSGRIAEAFAISNAPRERKVWPRLIAEVRYTLFKNFKLPTKLTAVFPALHQFDDFSRKGYQNIRGYTGIGDDLGTWKFVNADKARIIVLADPDDRKNIAAMKTIARLGPKKGMTRVFTHIENSSLRDELVRQTRSFHAPKGYSFEPFSVGHLAARQFFVKRNIFYDTHFRGHDNIHWLVFGLNPATITFLYHFLRISPFPAPEGTILPYDPRPKITLLCPSNNPHLNKFKYNIEACERFVKFKHWEYEPNKGAFPGPIVDEIKADAVTSILLADLDGCEMELALELRGRAQREKLWRAPIYFLELEDIEFDSIFGSGMSLYLHDEVAQVALLADVCRLDLLTDQIDALARILHNDYLQNVRNNKEKNGEELNPRLNASHVKWPELSETFRASNRRAAAHVKTKTEYLGILGHMSSIGVEGFDPLQVSTDVINALARAEHDSWWIDHLLMGWLPKSKRNDAYRHHDNLIPFDELGGEQKKDINQVETILRLMHEMPAEPGALRACREIGLIGYNQISKEEAAYICQSLMETVLSQILHDHTERHLRFLTPLAPGSDLIMVETLISALSSDAALSWDIICVETIEFDDLVSSYLERFEHGNVWTTQTDGEAYQSYLDALNGDKADEEVNGKLRAAVEASLKCVLKNEKVRILDLRPNEEIIEDEKCKYNVNYFALRPDTLVACLDKNREEASDVGVAFTVGEASKNDTNVVLIELG